MLLLKFRGFFCNSQLFKLLPKFGALTSLRAIDYFYIFQDVAAKIVLNGPYENEGLITELISPATCKPNTLCYEWVTGKSY